MELLIEPNLSTLSGLKEYRYKQIDKRTQELIAQGFIYSSITFSLSTNAQTNLLGTYTARDLLTYPFSWNAIDDSSTYQIADANEMAVFFMTALAAKKAHQDSGTALKTQIRDAVDMDAVNLIIDNR